MGSPALSEPRTLVIDYSTDRTAGTAISSWLPPHANHEVFTPGTGSFPDPAGFTHVIHSGSAHSICDEAPFQEEAESLIKKALGSGVFQMGICYGHQLLARTVSGRAAVRRNAAGGETGWCDVRWSPTALHLLGIPGSTRVFQFHYDEVVSLPPGSMILAWSPVTFIQSFISFRLRLFGVQFHPEFDRESGNALFTAEREKIAKSGLDAGILVQDGPDPAVDGGYFRSFLGPVWSGR